MKTQNVITYQNESTIASLLIELDKRVIHNNTEPSLLMTIDSDALKSLSEISLNSLKEILTRGAKFNIKVMIYSQSQSNPEPLIGPRDLIELHHRIILGKSCINYPV